MLKLDFIASGVRSYAQDPGAKNGAEQLHFDVPKLFKKVETPGIEVLILSNSILCGCCFQTELRARVVPLLVKWLVVRAITGQWSILHAPPRWLFEPRLKAEEQTF